MKKIILFAGLLFCSLINAQDLISVQNDGEEIEDGHVFTFNHLHSNSDPAEIKIKVTNISDSPLNLKLRIEDMQNTDDVSFFVQFCFGTECYFDVNVGSSVPSAVDGLLLAPGASNTDDDHFFSNYPGADENLPVEYTMAVIQVDSEGNQVGENLRTFTYKYDANALGTDDFNSLENMGISINNTVVKDQLNLNAAYNATMQIYAINGQLVRTADIKTGAQSVDLSDLNAAVYIAKFTTEENKTSQIRIVKN